jgi:glycosyltransferase involved in cell wall biosynthesis
MSDYRLSVCLPCNGRPKRTLRILEQIKNQTINNWELFIIGDCCSYFQELIKIGYLEKFKKEIELNKNNVIYTNLDRNYGGYGYHIRNIVKREATSPYLIYIDNDDCIKPNHFENYLSEIEGTDYDFVYFNSFVEPLNSVRTSNLSAGNIGHSEIIVNLDFLRKMPDHIPDYEHDWVLINNFLKHNPKYKKSDNPYSYIVKSIYAIRESVID